jgi:precorrin-6A/cobalt-precorrin-6A reductase
MLRVLILGGTTEGRRLGQALLSSPDISVVSSLAGQLREPRALPGEVRVGGFGGPDGLVDWLEGHHIQAVVDATHPFAARMSASAEFACAKVGLPLLRFTRAGWAESDGDDWRRVESLTAAAALVPELGRRVFLTTGRTELAPFAALEDVWFLLRVIDAPDPPLPRNRTLLQARGPFALAEELELMRRWQIDVLVTKDSGGQATAPKLLAARQLHIPVVMVDRPASGTTRTVFDLGLVLDWLQGVAAETDPGL